MPDVRPGEHRATALPTHRIERFTPTHWGAFVMDLVLDPERLEDICVQYATTPEDIAQMMETNKAFKDTVRDIRDQVRALGPNASFVLRNRMLAEFNLPLYQRLIMDEKTPVTQRAKMIETQAGWAHLSGTNGKQGNNEKQGAVGVSMNITFGESLRNLVGDANVVINAEKTGEDHD